MDKIDRLTLKVEKYLKYNRFALEDDYFIEAIFDGLENSYSDLEIEAVKETCLTLDKLNKHHSEAVEIALNLSAKHDWLDYQEWIRIMAKKKYLKLRTHDEVRRSMTRVANMLLNDEIEPKKANALIYAGNAVLNSIRTDEYEKKIKALEVLLYKNGIS